VAQPAIASCESNRLAEDRGPNDEVEAALLEIEFLHVALQQHAALGEFACRAPRGEVRIASMRIRMLRQRAQRC